MNDDAKAEYILVNLTIQMPDIDEEAILAEVNREMEGQPPLSETIIQERREGW